MIRGDASLTYQDLADVLSACDEAGIRNVRLPVRSARPTDKNAVIVEPGSVHRPLDDRVTRTEVLALIITRSTHQTLSQRSNVWINFAVRSDSDHTSKNRDRAEPHDSQRICRLARVLALRSLISDHFRRDGARGHAVPAG